MNTPLSELPFTLVGLRQAYRDGLSPADVMVEALRRLEAVDDPAIFLHLADAKSLVDDAKGLGAFDPGRPLWGIPFAVKDNIDVLGMLTTAACPAFAYAPTKDAVVVARLRAAGAIPIGKTNLDQFATGLVGVRSPYGVPHNAIDPAIVPGGSSSGSAVAVAHGIVSFALGTDTAGSGRVPAALNNIVGLKPSLGALSASGVVPACRTLDTISIFALTVTDAHEVFRRAAAFDPEDAYSKKIPTPPMTSALPAPRMTAPDAASLIYFGDTTQAVDFERTIEDLVAQGAQVTRADFTPFYDVASMLYDGAWVAERYAAIEPIMTKTPSDLHPVTRSIIAKAEGLTAVDAFKGLYRLEALRRACDPVLAGADMLCVPSIPTFYTCADLAKDPILPNSNLGTYTNFVNLLDLCAIAVPTGLRADARPGGVTFIAKAGRDAAIAAEARRLMHARAPQLGATCLVEENLPAKPAENGVGEDDILIAVCGAHMSGLPLNGELTARGARFIGASQTAPAYSLFALPGDPPMRPGLVRKSSPGGSSIKVEVWAMPKSEFGAFIEGVRAPLAIGTIALRDGSMVKGFICEDAGLDGAEDISALGGWRNFIARAR